MIQLAIIRRKRMITLSLVILVPVVLLLRHLHSQQYSILITNQRVTEKTFSETNFNNGKSSYRWRLKRRGHDDQVLKRWLRNDGNDWRCDVHTVGCFKPSKNEDSNSWIYYHKTNMNYTDWQCIQACSQRSNRKHEMIGVRAGGECICAHYLNYSSLVSEDECNNMCANDQSFDCENEKRLTKVYQLTDRCSAVSALRIEDAQMGCFQHQSQSWNYNWEHYVSNEDQTRESCFMECEIAGFPLVVLTNQRSCYCGLMTHESSQLLGRSPCSTTTFNNIPVYKTLNEDRRCSTKRFLYPGELTKKVGLISFPGSGNTWTRHLIESATGIYTGSAYNSDWGLLSGGFMGELLPADSNKVSVIKSHSAGMHGIHIDAVINIYRNPYDAMMAEFKRLSGGHVGNIDENKLNQTAFKTLVMKTLASGWLHLTRASAQKNIPRLIIPFEEMVSDPVKYAEKMARFILGENVNEDDLKKRLLCLKYSSMGGFKRPKKHLSFDLYDDEMKVTINRNIDLLAKHLQKEGFSNIPNYKRPLTR